MSITVRVDKNNVPNVISAVGRAGDDLAKPVADGIKDIAERQAPVLYGFLRASIQTTGGGMHYEVSAESRAGGAPREYAYYQEYGTSKMSAQPYMMPAFVEGVASKLPQVSAEFGAKIEAAAGG